VARITDLLRGVVALVALVVLVVGVPLALLWATGSPWPSTWPSLAAAQDALSTPHKLDGAVVYVLSLVVWLAWLQLAVAVAAEVVGRLSHRTPARAPAPGAVRRLAATLVAAVALSAGTIGAPRSVPVPLPLRAALVPVGTAAAAAPSRAVATPSASATPALGTWTVGRRDTMWSIAEQVFGAGERWPELYQMNLGREVAPGTTFGPDVDAVEEGWQLAVPRADAVVRVEPGDCLSSLAERHYGDANQWPRIWDANRGHRFGDRTFDDPNLILVGWPLVVPDALAPAAPGRSVTPAAVSPAAAASPAGEPVSPPGSLPAADAVSASTLPTSALDTGAPNATHDVAVVEPPGATLLDVGVVSTVLADDTPNTVAVEELPDTGRGQDALGADVVDPPTLGPSGLATIRPGPDLPGWVQPAGWSGGVLMATGIAGLVATRRRRRLRSTARDEVLPTLADSLARIDVLVRGSADTVGVARLDVVLRSLARTALPGRARPLFVLHGPDGTVEVELVEPAGAPPEPWTPGGPTRWRLDPSVPLPLLVQLARDASPPCPALVQLGRTDDGIAVYVDLEAAGVLALDGDADATRSLARAMLASLALTPLADVLTVVACGLEASGLYPPERVEVVDDADAAFEVAASRSSAVRAAAPPAGSTFALRGKGGDAWEPVVAVLVGSPLSPADADHLSGLVGGGGQGVAVVTDAAVDGVRCRLRAVSGSWVVEPLGLTVTPSGLAADELAALAALADAVAEPGHAIEAPEMATSPFDEPAWSFLVRLLGPVDVVGRDGAAVVFERSKALELVAWLAAHPGHTRRSMARAALWETDVRDATLANVVSDARRSLARALPPPEGEEWIARSTGDRLPLHSLVRSDADLLEARLAHARGASDDEAVAVLRPGVATLRDQPLAGSSFFWPDSEALSSELVVLATSAAAELAARCLTIGDVDGTFWSTAQGLRVLPGHEQLVCLRMEAHAARGDLSGVRAEFQAYERVVLADGWGSDALASKVVATRHRLLRTAT
jgi:nucleoid-associated protein YgaU